MVKRETFQLTPLVTPSRRTLNNCHAREKQNKSCRENLRQELIHIHFNNSIHHFPNGGSSSQTAFWNFSSDHDTHTSCFTAIRKNKQMEEQESVKSSQYHKDFQVQKKTNDYLLLVLVATRLLVVSIAGTRVATIVGVRVLRRRRISVSFISLRRIPIVSTTTTILRLIRLSL